MLREGERQYIELRADALQRIVDNRPWQDPSIEGALQELLPLLWPTCFGEEGAEIALQRARCLFRCDGLYDYASVYQRLFPGVRRKIQPAGRLVSVG